MAHGLRQAVSIKGDVSIFDTSSWQQVGSLAASSGVLSLDFTSDGRVLGGPYRGG